MPHRWHYALATPDGTVRPTTVRVPRRRRHRGTRTWWFVAGAALIVGVALFVAATPTSDPKMVVLAPATTTTPQQPTAVRGLVIPWSRPVHLSIAALGINIAVGTLGIQANHQVQVPKNAHVVDWFRDGPPPGQIGSAVFLGHVDSFRGPGTFFYLKELKPGNVVTTVLADDTVEHFVVVKVVQYSKANFPDRLVYGSHGTRSLQLVTCGGTFDHATGSYESNVVVFTRLVSAVVARA